VICLEPGGVEIPSGISTLEEFRRWVHSEGFPERGRFDWVSGRLEVDLSPEDLNTHGSPKTAIAIRLGGIFVDGELGAVYIDKARLSSPLADLSAEPDILVLLFKTLEEGRARLVPKSSGEPGRFVEIEGAADLVVECVSDLSKDKDKKRLPKTYHAAGVREYWIVDARGANVELRVLVYSPKGYVPSPMDAEGYTASPVLEARVKLVVLRRAAGLTLFRLEVRPLE
jgi:Uma2 family endonuclease